MSDADGSDHAEDVTGTGTGTGTGDDERWLVIKGKRWRRTDPCLAEDVVTQLKSQLGRGRSAVRAARGADEQALRAARRRVQLAKLGLGERGPYWWEQPEAQRRQQAADSLRELDGLER